MTDDEQDLALVGVIDEEDGDEAETEAQQAAEPEASEAETAELAAWRARVREANRLVRERRSKRDTAQATVNHAKAVLKEDQLLYEEAMEELQDVIECRSQPRLPFPEPEGSDAGEARAEDEAWRDVPIAELRELGLPENICTRLIEADIKTMGALAAFTEDGSHLTDIRGIGEAKADEIDDAVAEFWAKWKERGQGAEGSGGSRTPYGGSA